MTIAEAKDYFERIMNFNGVEKITLLSIPTAGKLALTQNLFILALKQLMFPNCFAYMGLTHESGHSDYLTQLERGIRQGFDGLKILESKPDIQKELGIRMSDPMFDEMFDYAEELKFPIIMHVADPDTSWDRHKVDKWALEHGRCYDGPGFLSREDLYDDVKKILNKHPNLCLTLAHFGFLAEEPERAEHLLEGYPNVCFDITPGKEMYLSFSANPIKSKKFFQKYADRIFFGTDVNDQDVFHYHCDLYHLVRDMLSGSEQFDLWNNHYTPMKLEKEICDKIFYENHRALLGDIPNHIDKKAVSEELKRLYKSYDMLSESDKNALVFLIDFFK